jgi:hypothetical protein
LGFNARLKYAFIRFAEYASLDISKLVFFYDEKPVSDDDTPSTLGLTHQFIIVAKYKEEELPSLNDGK